MIDLHCHSHFSDGHLSPEDLLLKARLAHITCLALTDHDTIEGVDALAEAAASMPIQIITGIEISARWKKQDVHIIGLHFKKTKVLSDLIARQIESRLLRARAIGAQLEALGIDDAFDKARAIAGHERVGRLHFAELLVQSGKSADRQMAFKQYLGRGKPAYVPCAWVDMEEAVETIRASEGAAVIAHPLKYGLTRSKLHALILAFKEAGGRGIEVVSGEMTVTDIKTVAGLALRFSLSASTGSDYHGDAYSRVGLGKQALLPDNVQPIWLEWTKGIL